MSRHNNSERAKWRRICRETLCDHINNTLGLKVLPNQVRLTPKEDDKYKWEMGDKTELFRKQLSKQSIGPLMHLCREVGKSFRAVLQSQNANLVNQAPLPCQIQLENTNLQEELCLTRQRLELAEKRLERVILEFRILKRKDAVKAAFIMKHRTRVLEYIQDSRNIIVNF
ncbi:hypothetical protein LZ30DRAFT_803069 [Colletotrichum cereale]|nr:hypothetical protein LZ30DRAFT_803069 [Colletotrichum cereale]